jgi:hypothetical protein
MNRNFCVGISAFLFVTNAFLGCKNKDSSAATTVSGDSSKIKKQEMDIRIPAWTSLAPNAHDTLQFVQIADFGMGCPRAGDPDIDGKYTDGCPQRGIVISDVIKFSNAIFAKKMWEGHFKYNSKEMIDCAKQMQASYLVFRSDSFVVFDFNEYFDSIQVRYQNGVAHLDFKGYVNPQKRGFPKSNSDVGIDGDDMADNPETILILKAKMPLDRIEMTSPSGVIRGDYLVKNNELIPVSKKSIWPCK